MSVTTNPTIAGGNSGGGGGGGTWGSITGTLSNQTDLENVLNVKAPGNVVVSYTATTLTITAAAHDGNIIAASNAGAQAISLNTGAALTTGFTVVQKGAGIVTIGGTAALTAPNGLSTSGVDTTLVVVPTGTNAYDVFAASTADATYVTATAGATPPINLASYTVFDLTLTANCTPSFSGAVSGKAYSATLIIRQDATGSWTLTLPTTKWSGGTAYATTGTASSIDVITLTTVDGGSTYLGFVAGKAFA